MKFMRAVRAASIKKTVRMSLVLILLAIFVAIGFDAPEVLKTFNPKTLDELTPETMEGAYVEDYIYFIYTAYAEEEEYENDRPTGKITGVQYLIDMNYDYYMSLFAHKGNMDKADALEEASYQYYMGELDGDDVPVLEVKGTIEAMEPELNRYYYELAEGDSSMIDIMVPYYLEMDHIGGSWFGVAWAAAAACVVLVIAAIVLLIKAITGGYLKQLNAKINLMGDRDTTLEKLDSFYESAELLNGIRINRDFVLFQNGRGSILLRPWEVTWVYQRTIQRRTNGIPSGKSYELVINTVGGESYTIAAKKKAVEPLMEALSVKLPGTVFGYDEELSDIYQNNRQLFIDRWEEAIPGCTERV